MKEMSPASASKFQSALSLAIIAFVVVFIASWWARKIVIETMDLYDSFPLIKGFFRITHVRNPGAAFGIFSKFAPLYRTPLLLAVSSIAILMIGYLLIKNIEEHWAIRLGLSFLAGGASGNFYERLTYGEVVDYLDFYLGDYHWPAFNLADVSISSGVVTLD